MHKRICMVSPLYHPDLGGVGRQAVYLSEYLQKSGMDIVVICRDIIGLPFWNPPTGIRIIRLSAASNTKHDLEEKTFYNFLISLSFSIHLLFTLLRNREMYEIVHFHGASLPLIINTFPLKMLGKRIVAKVAGAKMNTEAGSFRGKYLGLGSIFIKILRHVDMFIAISNEIRDDLLNDGLAPDKIFRTTNFIVPGIFSPVVDASVREKKKKDLGIAGHCKMITFSGRLVKRKRLDILLKAVAEIARTRRDIQLIILGQGDLMRDLRKLSAELCLDDIVQFRGLVSNMSDYLHITDIYVFTSEKEGMPNAILEAMACRLPVIATNIGGITDVIQDHINGILVEVGDVDSMRDALLKLMDDEEFSEQIADSAYRTIKNHYYLESIGRQYMLMYETLL